MRNEEGLGRHDSLSLSLILHILYTFTYVALASHSGSASDWPNGSHVGLSVPAPCEEGRQCFFRVPLYPSLEHFHIRIRIRMRIQIPHVQSRGGNDLSLSTCVNVSIFHALNDRFPCPSPVS
jgi:hypothetical protein